MSDPQAPVTDLNVTPLIDVLLVLLVMFIITIPIQSHAVKLDLPGPGPIETINPTKNVIEVTSSGTVLWNGAATPEKDLRSLLAATQQRKPIPELHLRPAPDARYEDVDRVLAIIKREQVQKFGFVGNERYALN